MVIVATGARPYEPAHALGAMEVVQVWDILAGARPRGHVMISDWGGDAAALDCAELLAGLGGRVTLAVGSVMPGETLHQYVRNSYLGRLSRAGVSIRHYLGLHSASAGAVRFRNIFAPELETVIEARRARALARPRAERRSRRGAARARAAGARGGRLPVASLDRGGDPRGDARGAR